MQTFFVAICILFGNRLQMSKVNGRQKGANFERFIAKELFLETGTIFRRNLSQYQQKGLADLTPDGTFPFLIECKRYAAGVDPKWWDQICEAARSSHNKNDALPCLIYKLDRQSIKCRIPIEAMRRLGEPAPKGYLPDAQFPWSYTATLEWPDFIYVCRELMADV
jgi:hypothetical protein